MDKNNKTIVVTGANRGIGYEVCKQLKSKGYRVFLTGKDAQKSAHSAKVLEVEHFKLDLTNDADITKFYNHLHNEGMSVYSLVNNAGIVPGSDSDILNMDQEVIEFTLRTNALGPLYLAQKLEPLIEPEGNIVMVSSGAGEICSGLNTWSPAYSISKTLMNVITRQMAHSFSDDKIKVNAVCPGWVRTDMGGPSAPRGIPEGADTIVWLAEGGDGSTGNFFRDRKKINW